MAARCNLGTQERKMVRDLFIFIMRNRDAQNELCRKTKTTEEALKIAMSYYINRPFPCRPRERPTQLQGVLYRSKRNQSAIFVDPEDEEYQGDGANIGIGEEAERKNVDVTTAINRISPQNTDNYAQRELSHAISAKTSGISKRLVGENGWYEGTTNWTNPRGQTV